ncbi:hypothetical protein S83_050350 [Arachis hypogaea]
MFLTSLHLQCIALHSSECSLRSFLHSEIAFHFLHESRNKNARIWFHEENVIAEFAVRVTFHHQNLASKWYIVYLFLFLKNLFAFSFSSIYSISGIFSRVLFALCCTN